MKKILTTNIRWLFLGLLVTVGAGSAWGDTSTLTFTSACGGSGTADDNAAWTVTSDGTESSYDNTKGIHYGTNSAAVQYINLTTSGISGTITKIIVNASTASGVTATVSVTVGGSAFGGNAQSLTSSATNYTFNGSASGTIVVSISKSASATKALYVKSIEVTYTPDGSGGSSNFTWDLTTNSYSSASESSVVWSHTIATMTSTRVGNNTVANNYLPTTYNSSRFYKSNTLTIAPASGYTITNVEFTATSTDFASAFQSSAWTNATSSQNGTLITVTPTDGTSDFVATIGGTCGFTSVKVYYTTAVQKTATTTSFPESNYSASFLGTFTAPIATVSAEGSVITDVAVTYSSSNTSVATVHPSTGAVTIIGIGTTTITATYAGNSTYAGSSSSYTLTIIDERTPTNITFLSNRYEALINESFTAPIATLSPSAAGNVTYSSSNTSVSTVDINTGEVSLVAVGTTTITASFAGNGTYKPSSASYTLDVKNSAGGSSYTWDLSIADYTSASTTEVDWSSTYATMALKKATSSTNANNALGGTGSYTSTRVYQNQTLTITPVSGYQLKSIELTATSNTYANYLNPETSSWTNASVSVSGSKATVTPTNGTTEVVVTIGTATWLIGATVHYEPTSSIVPEDPTLTASCSFWPNTTETASKQISITPTTVGSTVRFTTDGTNPSTSHGTIVLSSATLTISETTTVKAIAYIGSSTSSIATATYTLGQTVNSIAAFKALPTGTEARLYLDPENNARVLHASGSEIYVRDNTGAICIYLASNLQNPIPRHDYHVAGWIIGKYQPYKNLPEMVATSNTSTHYLAFAAPVTETATEPIVISASDFDDYKADWVTISDLRTEGSGNNIIATLEGCSFKVYNKYKLNADSKYQDPYDGALVDLTGLAVPYESTREIVPATTSVPSFMFWTNSRNSSHHRPILKTPLYALSAHSRVATGIRLLFRLPSAI